MAFYEETAMPLLTRVIAGFDHWISPMYRAKDGMWPELDFDPDSISALTEKRQAQWAKVQNAAFLTRNEQREAADYGPVPGGDADEDGDGGDDYDGAKFNPNHDELGRFTFGPGGAAADDDADNDSGDSGDDGENDDSTDASDSSGSGSGPGIYGLPSNIENRPDATPASDTPAVPPNSNQWPPQGNSNLNVANAVSTLDDRAQDSSTGNCAAYVRQAINAGGVSITPPASGNAQDYGPSLENAGFVPLTPTPAPDYDPQTGDVVVIQHYDGGNPAGHMAMYDGNNWVSDFVQNPDNIPSHDNIWPGPGYREYQPPYTIYRP